MHETDIGRTDPVTLTQWILTQQQIKVTVVPILFLYLLLFCFCVM